MEGNCPTSEFFRNAQGGYVKVVGGTTSSQERGAVPTKLLPFVLPHLPKSSLNIWGPSSRTLCVLLTTDLKLPSVLGIRGDDLGYIVRACLKFKTEKTS